MAEGSLVFYCGALGSGKTSWAFEEGLCHLLKGGTVAHNIDCDSKPEYKEKIRRWMADDHGLEFDPSRLVALTDGTEVWKGAVTGSDDLPAMLIIDEAHVEHNARDWDKSSAAQLLFNTMARKLNIHIIYITQDINNVDKQFRRMAQRIEYCRNLGHHKLLGFLPFPFSLFLRVPYVMAPGAKPMRQSPIVTMRPLSWGMFNSKALVGRAKETFSVLQAAQTSPLRRVPRKPVAARYYALASAVAVAVGVFL